MDRGFVFKVISTFITRLDPRNSVKNLTTNKFKALKIICSHEHFLQLCIPITKPLGNITDIMEDFFENHYLIGLLLDEVANCLNCQDMASRLKAISTLRDILWKHSESPLIDGNPEKLKLFASMFFPFIIIVSKIIFLFFIFF